MLSIKRHNLTDFAHLEVFHHVLSASVIKIQKF